MVSAIRACGVFGTVADATCGGSRGLELHVETLKESACCPAKGQNSALLRIKAKLSKSIARIG
jgi:hypothetical protein